MWQGKKLSYQLEKPGDLVGQVLWGANNIFQISCQDGRERQCRLRGKILKQKSLEHNPLICGDFVLLTPTKENQGLIYDRIKRYNALQRRNIKRGEPQTFAANIDGIILLVSWSEPPLRTAFLDRLLVATQRTACPTVILLNKIDCISNFKDLNRFRKFLRLYRSLNYNLGIELWPISMKYLQPHTDISNLANTNTQPENLKLKKSKNLCHLLVQTWLRWVYLWPSRMWLQKLYQTFGGKLYAILGASGVGKSSLCNYWFPQQLQETSAISQKWQRGVHTTVLARTLLQYHNGQPYRLIDTPGMRNFLPEMNLEELPQLQDYYPEFHSLRKICAYSSCQHRNEPDCAVRDAADYQMIAEQRYLSYLNLYNDLENSFYEKPKYQTQGKDFGKYNTQLNDRQQKTKKDKTNKYRQKKLKLNCDEESNLELD